MATPNNLWKLEKLLLLLILVLLIVLVGIICRCCRGDRSLVTKHWGSWNILLPHPIPQASYASVLTGVEDQITAYLKDSGFKPKFRPWYCPCDSLLINLDVNITPLEGSGGSKVPPPTSGFNPTPPSGGGPYAVQFNNPITPPEYGQRSTFGIPSLDTLSHYIQSLPMHNNGPSASSKLIVVIDTGIDTVMAKASNFNGLLVNDPSLLYNFIPFAQRNYYTDDDTALKHGTFVTQIIADYLNQRNRAYPRILTLKSIDSNGVGSTFSASCALRYAIQQHADVINASWGYYGKVDSILYHYIGLCDSAGIPVIAAAGNFPTPPPHDSALIASTSVNLSGSLDLTSRPSFYPACFSETFPNTVVAVTGLNSQSQTEAPCYYQNYSRNYVSIGVLNHSATQLCCAYYPWNEIDQQHEGYAVEGSSFEAPVVTADLFLDYSAPITIGTGAPQHSDPVEQLANLNFSAYLTPYVMKGRFISYKQYLPPPANPTNPGNPTNPVTSPKPPKVKPPKPKPAE